MIWTVPNILTLLRLLAAPGVAIMFLYFSRPYADWLALVLFLSAAITDWFDGYLARLWKQETKIGAMLDPIADKAMVDDIMLGRVEDLQGLRWKFAGMEWAGWTGLLLLWVAALLTVVTGFDYLRKALPYLKER
jgi:CDP-diacylglycerol--glycerol-3-phosphate 3-phosphatidyltransferase